MAVSLKSPAEVDAMRRAGRVVAEVLALVESELRPGVSTAHLDALAEAHIRRSGAVPSFKGRIEAQTPMGRVGEPEELLGTLLLLSSDAGSYITGQTIFVDGGMTSTVGASPYPDDLYALHSQIMPHGLGDRIVPGA